VAEVSCQSANRRAGQHSAKSALIMEQLLPLSAFYSMFMM
jgi:hypothetical protein